MVTRQNELYRSTYLGIEPYPNDGHADAQGHAESDENVTEDGISVVDSQHSACVANAGQHQHHQTAPACLQIHPVANKEYHFRKSHTSHNTPIHTQEMGIFTRFGHMKRKLYSLTF